MVVVIFNIPGLIMLAIGFGVAYGLGQLFGFSGEGPLMIAGGPLIAGLDLFYRAQHDEPHWFHPSYGGMFCFLPCSGLGIFWLGLGIVRTVNAGG